MPSPSTCGAAMRPAGAQRDPAGARLAAQQAKTGIERLGRRTTSGPPASAGPRPSSRRRRPQPPNCRSRRRRVCRMLAIVSTIVHLVPGGPRQLVACRRVRLSSMPWMAWPSAWKCWPVASPASGRRRDGGAQACSPGRTPALATPGTAPTSTPAINTTLSSTPQVGCSRRTRRAWARLSASRAWRLDAGFAGPFADRGTAVRRRATGVIGAGAGQARGHRWSSRAALAFEIEDQQQWAMLPTRRAAAGRGSSAVGLPRPR